MWHVSSRSGVATLWTAIHLLLTYLRNTGHNNNRFCEVLTRRRCTSSCQRSAQLHRTARVQREWRWERSSLVRCTSLIDRSDHSFPRLPRTAKPQWLRLVSATVAIPPTAEDNSECDILNNVKSNRKLVFLDGNIYKASPRRYFLL